MIAKREGVEALVLAGSTATVLADEESDYDLYAYTRETVPVEFRAQLLKPRAARLELHNIFWDRRAWFQTLQDRLKSTPYPDRIVEGVIKMNLPVLGAPSILTSSRFVRPSADGTESASITGPRLGWPAISTSYPPPIGVSTRARSAC